jgi:hypothetical protein
MGYRADYIVGLTTNISSMVKDGSLQEPRFESSFVLDCLENIWVSYDNEIDTNTQFFIDDAYFNGETGNVVIDLSIYSNDVNVFLKKETFDKIIKYIEDKIEETNKQKYLVIDDNYSIEEQGNLYLKITQKPDADYIAGCNDTVEEVEEE